MLGGERSSLIDYWLLITDHFFPLFTIHSSPPATNRTHLTRKGYPSPARCEISILMPECTTVFPAPCGAIPAVPGITVVRIPHEKRICRLPVANDPPTHMVTLLRSRRRQAPSPLYPGKWSDAPNPKRGSVARASGVNGSSFRIIFFCSAGDHPIAWRFLTMT
jgi:hypothetical protein